MPNRDVAGSLKSRWTLERDLITLPAILHGKG
jgi:hypothetical protein